MSDRITRDNGQISARQFMILVILCTVGDSILILPTIIAANSKQDAWITMLISCLIGIGIGTLYGLMIKKMQGASLTAFMQQTLGRAVGGFICLLFIVYFIYLHITLTSEMTQFITTQLMPETPGNAVLILFLTVVIIAYRLGLETFARMGEILFPFFMLFFMFMVVFLLPQIDASKMQPILAEGFSPIWSGLPITTAVPFMETIIILAVVPHLKGNKSALKPLLKGLAIGGLILFITVLFCVLVLGSSLMETKYYPTFILAQKITVGSFLERMEAILTFMWITTVYFKTLLIFFAIIKSIEQLFRLKKSNMLTIPLAMILLVGSVISTPNIVVYNNQIKFYWAPYDITMCLVLPILLMGLSSMRGNGKRKPNPTTTKSEQSGHN
ncbi:spore germination protein KB [Paenibacillus endophyticus]|uniref:Spore germination protein KB n=1 Tax=Paenibacillus endophyticus TaxID=1294268 RepID=A0A7W5G9T8_9BACL|nr:endospore germination permease [Paenibacillus endophyticus]MBB3152529.1 spore germination protein KB [Paenibacillus endophyticus]